MQTHGGQKVESSYLNVPLHHWIPVQQLLLLVLLMVLTVFCQPLDDADHHCGQLPCGATPSPLSRLRRH